MIGWIIDGPYSLKKEEEMEEEEEKEEEGEERKEREEKEAHLILFQR